MDNEQKISFEINLFNPLWAYDLFPEAQSSWNRMPFTGADFETESASDVPDNNPSDSDLYPQENPNDEPSSDDDNSDNPNGSSNDDEEQDTNFDPNNNDNNDNNLDPEPDNSNNDAESEERSGNGNREPEFTLENPDPNNLPNIPGLTITETPDGSYDYHREFNSWNEFVSCASDESLYAWKYARQSHNLYQSTAGASATFPEAVNMAQFIGWPEGRKLLSDLMANIFTKPEVFEIWNFDVAGMLPIVPAYLSGDPACMMIEPDSSIRTQHPIIRIDYNHYVTGLVKPIDMMTRGAAILSLANNLEDRGFQTELRVIANCQGALNNKSCMFRYSVIFKKPSEFLDIDRAAFALAHPASMRRLGFAILEQHPELEPGFGSYYGYITSEPNDPESGSIGHIFVPGSDGNETEKTARTAVLSAADATTELLVAEAD